MHEWCVRVLVYSVHPDIRVYACIHVPVSIHGWMPGACAQMCVCGRLAGGSACMRA
jgi:hypothetical protein